MLTNKNNSAEHGPGTESGTGPVTGLVRFGRRLGGVLRTVCGAPAGWREERRGSFLVLVVGTLALMAILTVVYVAVGSTDRRTSSALAKLDKAEDVPDQFADYIAGIIGDDVFDTMSDGGHSRRETWDYPSTDWSVSSTQRLQDLDPARPTSSNELYFTPIGGHGDDPWLASTDPTWLASGISSSDLTSTSKVDPKKLYLFNRDWGHLSDIAPDGRYVNLNNLRNNFAVESGFGIVKGKKRISEALQLLPVPAKPDKPAPDEKYPSSAHRQTDFGVNITTANDKFSAYWGQRQVGAFREVYKGIDIPPNKDWYPDNQWADADGDGFYDSRWQEMVDARDQTGDGNPDAKNLLATDGRYRYFFATRIVDLSALVNVNTAADFRAAPTQKSPVGLFAGDVDLRRLLTLRDAYDLGFDPPQGVTATAPVAYNGLKQPTGSPSSAPADYAGYDMTRAGTVGGSAVGQPAAGAYEGLRVSMFSGIVPPYNATIDKFAAGYQIKDDVWKLADPAAGADRRADFYRNAGAQADGVGIAKVSGKDGYTIASTFNLTDALDLLTYRGINNPAMTTRLEQVVDGRDMSSLPDSRRYGPLRDNRGLDVEQDIAWPLTDKEDQQAMLRNAVDIRHLLTTVSGARPLYSTVLTSGADQLATTEVRLDVASMLKAGKVTEITRTIATALMPDATDPKAWSDPASNDFLQRKTEFYGGEGPELALRISAHLAVNMVDSYDKVALTKTYDEPSAYTLLLDRTKKSRLTDKTLFPWWNDDKKIDLTAAGLSAADLLGGAKVRPVGIPPAINIYGVEAQPFITEVTSFTAFWDSPKAAGGDADDQSISPDPTDPQYEEITIKGDVDEGNSDFLFRVVVFQLTNPFDVPVKLSTGNPAEPFFYIEFGGQTLMLSDASTGTGSGGALTLAAGETINCYVTSNDPAAIATRIGGFTTGITPDFMSKWADHQLKAAGSSVRVVRIPRVDGGTSTTAGTWASQGGFSDLKQGNATHVKLWRTLRSTGVDSTGNNSKANDLLADRMRIRRNKDGDPVQPNDGIDQAFTGNEKINGTSSGPEGLFDNTGFTITLFGSVRRPSSVDDTPFVQIGALPPWCLEPRTYAVGAAGEKWNKQHANTHAEAASKSAGDIDKGDFSGMETLDAWVASQLTTDPICNTVCEAPPQKPSEFGGFSIPANADNKKFTELVPEVSVNDNEFKFGTPPVSTIRTADVLLTWGIGPFETPMDVSGTTIPTTDVRRWTTLAEAMALALKYYDPSSPPAAGTFEEKLAGKVDVPGQPHLGALDRGNLRFDAFVPYFDRNVDGIFKADPITTPEPREERHGLGIPLAMNLLETLRGVPESTIPDQYGGLARLTRGLININTAPLAGQRLLPMLTPTHETGAWWWTSPIAGETPMSVNSDIAATMIAYRDKIAVPTRPDSSGTVKFVDFRDRAADGSYTKPPIDNPEKLNGRSGADSTGALTFPGTGITAIREQPGFRSLGEVLAARSVVVGTATTYNNINNIDYLGYDGNDNSAKGISSVLHKDSAGVVKANNIKDDYAEKLTVASGLLNTVSVRSDVYAVWFIVRGYQQSDVEGLRDTGQIDPMTPSIQRRYLMIVDRSNVVRRGDKPQILLFKEVPM